MGCPCNNNNMIYLGTTYHHPYQIELGNDEKIIVDQQFNLPSLASRGGGHTGGAVPGGFTEISGGTFIFGHYSQQVEPSDRWKSSYTARQVQTVFLPFLIGYNLLQLLMCPKSLKMSQISYNIFNLTQKKMSHPPPLPYK